MHPNLIKLLANNKGKGFFKAEAEKSDEATLYLYDMIVSDDWWGGITPIAFIKELKAISAPVIHLRINSPGGDVFAARAMQTAMNEHPSKIIAHIDGLCASAATFLAVSASESRISAGSMFMIHNAWTIAMGNAKDFADMAMLLGKIDGSIANDYVAKTGKELSQVTAWMDAETYFLGQEAVDAGFIDSVAEAAPKNKIDWDLSAYAHAPLQNHSDPDDNSDDPEQFEQDDHKIINHSANRPAYREMMA